MSRKIFVLDDDERACQLAERVLTEAGYKVMTRTTPLGSTTAVSAFQPDLVLLDIMMPALSGTHVVSILDQHMKPRPKIIFYSNRTASELRELAEKSKVEGFVCKTEGPNALLTKVKKILPSI